MSIQLTENAAAQIQKLKTEHCLGDNAFLRIVVVACSCTGFKYDLKFDTEFGSHDLEFEDRGIRVVTDEESYRYLNNSILDTALGTEGFIVQNPNVPSSCGCGMSHGD